MGFKKIEYLYTYVININDILERREVRAKIKSRNNKVVVSYSSSKTTSN